MKKSLSYFTFLGFLSASAILFSGNIQAATHYKYIFLPVASTNVCMLNIQENNVNTHFISTISIDKKDSSIVRVGLVAHDDILIKHPNSKKALFNMHRIANNINSCDGTYMIEINNLYVNKNYISAINTEKNDPSILRADLLATSPIRIKYSDKKQATANMNKILDNINSCRNSSCKEKTIQIKK